MSNILNVNQELKRVEYHIQRVRKCTDYLGVVDQEHTAKVQSNKMNIMLLLSTLYAFTMVCLRMIGNKLFDINIYLYLTIGSALIIFIITCTFPTKHMKNVGTICMLAVALASLTPIIPDLLGTVFADQSYIVTALVRIISIPIVLITWITVLSGDRGRSGRLKKIWKEMNEA